MSFKSSLVKTAINLTPKAPIRWVANVVLKGIADLQMFEFDLDARTAFAQVQLYGEAEAIEVSFADFAISNQDDSYYFCLKHAESNRPWLTNILKHITAKTWKIPVTPQLAAHIGLLAELIPAKQDV